MSIDALNESIIMFVAVWLVCPVWAGVALYNYRESIRGFFLGLLFGPLGLLVALLKWRAERKLEIQHRNDQALTELQKQKINEASQGLSRECPSCGKTIMITDVVCGHCGKEVVPIVVKGEYAPKNA